MREHKYRDYITLHYKVRKIHPIVALIKHRSVLYFIPILYCLSALYFYHVFADKLVNLLTKMATSSVERCWWRCVVV